MKVYAMTDKGKSAFSAIRHDPTRIVTNEPGYKILDYLYELGTGSVEDMSLDTGILRKQVVLKMRDYVRQGLVKVLADL